ncbi:calcium-binding protein, partial [Minwuia thermotolerans]|uniref:calcium-binding protein n=1 Tax=Minwuia thermotolerans TaxID=2056226 RepID=UPI000D6DC502
SIINGTNDAYDDGQNVTFGVFGGASTTYTGNTLFASADGRTIEGTADTSVAGLSFNRRLFVPDDEGFARFLESVTNTSGVQQTVTLTISGNLGSDGGTIVVDTSSGDALTDNTDRFIISDDSADGNGGFDPTMLHYFEGIGAANSADLVSLVNGNDNYTIGFTFTVEAGETASIMHFAAQNADLAAAQAKAAGLDSLESRFFTDLSTTEAAQLQNFAGGGAGVDVDLVAGTATLGNGDVSTLVGIENVIGTGDDDTIAGDGAANNLAGGDGADSIDGAAGDDAIAGGAGDDTLSFGAGADSVDAGAGDDAVRATVGELDGGDTLAGGASDILGDTLVLLGGGAVAAADLANASGFENIAFGTDANFTVTLPDSFIPAAGTLTVDGASLATGALTFDGSAETDGALAVTGGAAGDSLAGGAGADALTGGTGDDTLAGGGGVDSLDGGADTDTADYSGAAGAVNVDLDAGVASDDGDGATDALSSIENVTGSTGNDIISGDANANNLAGGAGNDTLAGGAGADTLAGGADTDLADYSADGAAIFVSMGAETATDGNGDTDSLTGIENILGTGFDDTVFGDSAANEITGGGGNDNIQGEAGNDTLIGGAGGDSLEGGSADDSLDGGTGADRVRGGNGNDTLLGGDDNDTLRGDLGDDFLDGGAGIDQADYSNEAAGVTVSLVAGSATDGNGGSDTLANIENVGGSAFDDTITGGALGNLLEGGGGGDLMDGQAGDDTLNGGDGNDTLTGGAGFDTIDGGAGIDAVSYAADAAPVLVDLSANTATDGAGDSDLLLFVENVIGSAFDDTLTGDALANSLEGGAGNDTIVAGAGADTLSGGDGSDTLLGGDDGDSLDGGAGDDSLFGEGGADLHSGGAGNDLIDGSDGNDTLLGGADDDTLLGAAGDDSMDGGDGTDVVSYALESGAVTVDLGLGTATDAGGGNDTLTAIENVVGSEFDDDVTGDAAANLLQLGLGNDTADGGDGADTVQGEAGDDDIAGEGGNDLLEGGAGNDTVIGDAGDDTLDGGDGIDTADYFEDTGAVVVDLLAGTATDGFGGADSLTGIENVAGSTFNDTISGDAGANSLDGDAGDDSMAGGDGADTVSGGDGADDLDGGAGDDSMAGGGGDDTMAGGAGNDFLVGDGGVNTADYSNAAAGVDVNLAQDTASDDGDGGVDTLFNFSAIEGSAFNDELTGSNDDDTLAGNGGADLLAGNDGNDILAGGAGEDTLVGAIGGTGAGDDTLDGGADADLVTYADATAAISADLGAGTVTGDASVGSDSITGVENLIASDFDDTVQGDAAANLLLLGAGGDLADGGDGADTIRGETGDDDIAGEGGNDLLEGGAGNDTVIGDAGDDTLDGGAGFDTADYFDDIAGVTVDLGAGAATDGFGGTDILISIEAAAGSAQGDLLIAGGNGNALFGNDGADTLNGGDGVDTIQGGGGADIIDGGDDLVGGVRQFFDTADFSDQVNDLLVSLEFGAALSGGDLDRISGIERVVGGSGSDEIEGGFEDFFEELVGGAGNDTLDGVRGFTAASYQDDPAGIVASLATGLVSDGFGGTDTLRDISRIEGSEFGDALTGGDSNDSFRGRGGADTIDGGAGSDEIDYNNAGATTGVNVDLNAGTASDGTGSIDVISNVERARGGAFGDTLTGDVNDNRFRGMDGADSMVGGDGFDTVDYFGDAGDTNGQSGVTVNLTTERATDGFGNTDTIQGFEAVFGTDFGDTITGDANANVLVGGDGTDFFFATAGNDTIHGGTDFLNGFEQFDDRLSFQNHGLNVTVDLAAGTASDGLGSNYVISGIERVIGSSGDDTLIGGGNNNNETFFGGDGADFIDGTNGAFTQVDYGLDPLAVSVNLNAGTAVDGFGNTDTLTGIEAVRGTNFSDTFLGSAASFERFRTRNGNDTVAGGDGVDELDYTFSGFDGVNVDMSGQDGQGGTGNTDKGGTNGVDTFTGIERIRGSEGDDTVLGDDGNNRFRLLEGNDSVDGGLGFDVMDFRTIPGFFVEIQGIVADLGAGTATDQFGFNDTLTSIEGIFGSELGDTLTGSADANLLEGRDGLDVLIGGAGDDTLDGGDDNVDGVRQFFDTADYSQDAAAVDINLFTGIGLDGFTGTDTLINIERVVGSAFDDTLTGGANSFFEEFDGGAGSDLIDGGDALAQDSGFDAVSYQNAGAAINATFVAGIGTVTGGDGGTDTLTGIERVEGTAFDDTLIGDGNFQTFRARGGNDSIEGGGSLFDEVDYLNSGAFEGADINLATGIATDGTGGTDTLSGIERVRGTNFDDTITGDASDNRIRAMGGFDVVDGGLGQDTIDYSSAQSNF